MIEFSDISAPLANLLAALTVEQFLGLYNYWIVIFLMMTGFYIVIARENLIKTVIGLNIFQTSVFLLYITMGKVQGGTAPIIQNPEDHDSHGEGPIGPAGDGHGATAQHADHAVVTSNPGMIGDPGMIGEGLHRDTQVLPAGLETSGVEASLDTATQTAGEVTAIADGSIVAEAYHGVVYSHPIPSVLMLTAIVVGIATTALALALIVRIREEYGTIEEDEILALDRNS